MPLNIGPTADAEAESWDERAQTYRRMGPTSGSLADISRTFQKQKYAWFLRKDPKIAGI